MPWFKVDDKLHDHHKARAAGAAAMGLWVLAGSWAADNLTDGFVPVSVCSRWARDFRKLAAQLVTVGLWAVASQNGEDGWEFHEWEQRQPTRTVVEQGRAEARERMTKRRARSPNVQPNEPRTEADRSGEQIVKFERSSENVLVPVPSRPDPTTNNVPSQLGEQRPVTLREPAVSVHPPRCTAHRNVDDPGPCNGCRAARERAERKDSRAAEHVVREAEAAARACTRCDGTRVVDESGLPTRQRCDHAPVGVSA